jgi:hypothetical protein
MLDRESTVRINALNYLDDILVRDRAPELTNEDKVNIAIFLIENLIPIHPDEDETDEERLKAILEATPGETA